MSSKHSDAILPFNEGNPNWSEKTEYNQMYLRSEIAHLNLRLSAYGHVFLNEAYDELGFPRTQAGALSGWILGDDTQNSVNIKVHEKNGEFRLEFITDGHIHDRI